jgi:hypothetical protein
MFALIVSHQEHVHAALVAQYPYIGHSAALLHCGGRAPELTAIVPNPVPSLCDS